MVATSSVSAPSRVALAFVLAAYVLPLVIPVPLMEDDEGLHAAIAIEMVEGGDWTVPRLLGQPFLDKPALYFWMQAASIAAFGASEFAVRLPGTLMALAGVVATGWLARVLFGAAVGRWAALCYATMLLPYAVSLAPLHDLVMVPLVALALGAFWRAHHATTTAQLAGWTLMAGVVLGLSMLGKGLTGVGLIGVGMVTWMAWTRTWSLRLVAVAAGALVLGALIAWPWYAAMETAAPGYLRYFILERHVGGVAGEAQRHAGRPFWYYVPVLLGGAWPWIVALVRRRPMAADLAERLVWSWLLADFVLLTLAGSKLATYLLPAFPAVALLAARALAAPRAHDATGRIYPWAAAVTAVLPLVAVVALGSLEGDWPGWTALAVALAPLAVLAWTRSSRGLVGAAGPAGLLAVTAATLITTSVVVRPMVATTLTARQLSWHMNELGVMPRTLLIVDEGVGSFLFYLRPDLRRGLTPDRVQRISRFSLGDDRDPGGVLVAIASDRLDGVRALYEMPPGAPVGAGAFHVVPWAELRPAVR